MGFVERRSLLGILTTLVVSVSFFFTWIKPNLIDASVTDMREWSIALLVYLAILIVIRLIVTVLHAFIEGMVVDRKDEEESLKEDERLKQIDLKASRHIGSSIAIGFLVSLILLAGGAGVAYLFYVMFASIILAGVVTDALIIYYHQVEI